MSKLLGLAGFAILTMGYVGFGSTSKASLGGIGIQQVQIATQTNATFGSDNCSFQLYRRAIMSIEGGNYKAISPPNPVTHKDGSVSIYFAHGAYQVLDPNVPLWTEKYYGKRLTPSEFRNNPEAQEIVFKGETLERFQKYGEWGDLGCRWLSGYGCNGNSNKPDVNGMTASKYGAMIRAYMKAHANECTSTVNEKPKSPRLQESEVSPQIAKESMDVLVQHLSGLPCNPPDLSGCGLGKAYRLSDGSIGLVEEHPPSAKIPRIHPGLSLFRAP